MSKFFKGEDTSSSEESTSESDSSSGSESEEEKPKQKQNFQVSAATRREPGDPGEQGFEQQKIIS
jgi:hypothetical protein